MKAVWLMAAGAVLGVAIAIPAIRASRNPETPLGRVRALLRLSPPPPPPPTAGNSAGDVMVADLARRYGPGKQSQFFEEWIIRDFFQDKRGGVFLDVGAADYKDSSNTWFLEHDLEWSGVAVDAQDRYRDGWQKFRPRSTFFTAFVSDTSNEIARLFLTKSEPFVASSRPDFTQTFAPVSGSTDVPTITLNDLLGKAKVTHFDFMSIDIELAEPKALAGLDIERFKPSLACVEAHPQVRQQILDYFAAHHYTLIGKYSFIDAINLWFMPIGTPVRFSVPNIP